MDRATQSPNGAERRVHRLFRTNNTEYHLRGKKCVGVYDLRMHQWLESHIALGSEYVCSLHKAAVNTSASPVLGERLFFSTDVMTSPLTAIERPEKATLTHYAA